MARALTATTSLFGRRPELAELERLARAERLLTLIGPAGIGKTALALAIADRSRRRGRVVGVARLAEVSDITSAGATLAGAFGVAGAESELVRWLRDRPAVLVADNCEHLRADMAAMLGRLLAASAGLRVIATSREPLALPGERVWRVPALSLPEDQPSWRRSDAVRLFGERAARALPGFVVSEANAAVVVALCRTLEGLPLAIELAAARLRHLSLDEIKDRLDRQLGILADDSPAVDPRQRTMRAAIDWSHALLEPAERTVWRRLSVFSGGWTLDAAEAVCAGEGPPTDVLAVLSRLIDRGILLADTSGASARYAMHEALRQYAHERLEEADESAPTHERHARHFAALVLAYDPEGDPRQHDTLRRLSLEPANINVAVRWSLAHDPATARRVLAQFYAIWIFLGPGFDPAEVEAWIARALETSPERDEIRARLLVALSQRLSLRDPGRGEACATEALEVAREVGEMKVVASSQYRAGLARLARGDRDGALDLFSRSIEEFAVGSPPMAAWILAHRGQLRGEAGDREGARGDIAKALEIAASHPGRVRARLIVHLFEGRHALLEDRPGDAETAFAHTVRGFLELGWGVPIARALEGLAVVAAGRGDDERALRLAGAADGAREMGADNVPRLGLERQVLAALSDRAGARGERLRADGRRMDLRRAAAYALEGPRRDALSARERDVAALVAEGLSDKEIARALRIAERTAENHVQHILNKLGARSRAQIAHWVALSTSHDGGTRPGT